uniref:Uncharacterized protein n=1 Tax=Setaria italica TaxID=4555 RepID=K4ANU3_SETIT
MGVTEEVDPSTSMVAELPLPAAFLPSTSMKQDCFYYLTCRVLLD